MYPQNIRPIDLITFLHYNLRKGCFLSMYSVKVLSEDLMWIWYQQLRKWKISLSILSRSVECKAAELLILKPLRNIKKNTLKWVTGSGISVYLRGNTRGLQPSLRAHLIPSRLGLTDLTWWRRTHHITTLNLASGHLDSAKHAEHVLSTSCVCVCVWPHFLSVCAANRGAVRAAAESGRDQQRAEAETRGRPRRRSTSAGQRDT